MTKALTEREKSLLAIQYEQVQEWRHGLTDPQFNELVAEVAIHNHYWMESRHRIEDNVWRGVYIDSFVTQMIKKGEIK